MTALVIFGLYLVGMAFTTVMVGRVLHQNDQEEMGVERAEDVRNINFVGGLVAGLIWPVSLLVVLGYYALRGLPGALLRTPLDREHAAKVELETLRKQARDLGLPYPGEDR